eukprot:s4178_g2.t1
MWIVLEQQQQRMLVVELLAVFCSVALEVVAKVLRVSFPASSKLELMVFERLAVFCSVALEVVAKVLRVSFPASSKLELMVFERMQSALREQLGASQWLQPPLLA